MSLEHGGAKLDRHDAEPLSITEEKQAACLSSDVALQEYIDSSSECLAPAAARIHSFSSCDVVRMHG